MLKKINTCYVLISTIVNNNQEYILTVVSNNQEEIINYGQLINKISDIFVFINI